MPRGILHILEWVQFFTHFTMKAENMFVTPETHSRAVSILNFYFPAVKQFIKKKSFSYSSSTRHKQNRATLQKPISPKFNPLCSRHLKLTENENFSQAFIYKSVPYVISPISASPAPLFF